MEAGRAKPVLSLQSTDTSLISLQPAAINTVTKSKNVKVLRSEESVDWAECSDVRHMCYSLFSGFLTAHRICLMRAVPSVWKSNCETLLCSTCQSLFSQETEKGIGILQLHWILRYSLQLSVLNWPWHATNTSKSCKLCRHGWIFPSCMELWILNIT